MPMDQIAYTAGYKYQTEDTYSTVVSIQPAIAIDTYWIRLTPKGRLTIRCGYAWDGPSGPAIDTPNFMRGSLVHDALYQLIREGHLPADCREPVDQELQRICLEDGMSALRAWWVYQAVRFGGGPAADPAHRRPVLRAP